MLKPKLNEEIKVRFRKIKPYHLWLGRDFYFYEVDIWRDEAWKKHLLVADWNLREVLRTLHIMTFNQYTILRGANCYVVQEVKRAVGYGNNLFETRPIRGEI